MSSPPSDSSFQDETSPHSRTDRFWRRFRGVRWSIVLPVALLLALFIGVFILWLRTPSVQQLNASRFAEASVAYTADGEVLTRYHDKNRVWVPLDSISQHVVDALLATEDRRFYDHWGVDVRRVGGAILQTLSGDPQGGSTITMQLARNAFPDIKDDFVLVRKVEEWIMALRLERHLSKDKILEMYLNTVPFMYNAFGIEAAAQTYFQKPAADLTLKEAATLVGLLKGTVVYNPVRNPEQSHARRNEVLENMVAYGTLSRERYEAIRDEPTPLDFKRISQVEGPAPYFAEYVREWLDDWANRNGYNLYTDGLNVHTSLDLDLQQAAEDAVHEVLPALQDVAGVEWSRQYLGRVTESFSSYERRAQQLDTFDYFWASHQNLLDTFLRQTPRYQQYVDRGMTPDSALTALREDAAFVDSVKTVKQRIDAGLVVLDPRQGYVRAWIGGRNFKQDEYDHVAMAKRQPGSTFKPFVYAAALDRGFRSTDRLRDTVMTYETEHRTWKPTNFGRATGRHMMLRDALAYSKNTVTAQLVDTLGPEWIAAMAERLGIRSDLEAVPSLGLGTSEVTLLELTSAYVTLAAQGRTVSPLPVTRITNRSGRTVATFSPEAREVIAPATAYETLDMMRGVVDYGTGTRLRHQYGAQGDLAAKTGTSQRGADGWFMLLHPDLVVGSWVGFATPELHFRSEYWGQGAHTALHIVGTFYEQARRQTEAFATEATFPEPLGYVPPDTTSRFPAADDTLSYYATDSLSWQRDSLFSRSASQSSSLGSVASRDSLLDQPPPGDNRPRRDTIRLATDRDETRRRDTTTDGAPSSPERPAPPPDATASDTTAVDAESADAVEEEPAQATPEVDRAVPDTLQRLEPRSPTADPDTTEQ